MCRWGLSLIKVSLKSPRRNASCVLSVKRNYNGKDMNETHAATVPDLDATMHSQLNIQR